MAIPDHTPSARADVVVKQLEGKLRVEIDDELFTEYYIDGYSKPILYPVMGPHGVPMTRNFPMKKGVAGEAEDHPHHKSHWFTHGSVNGIDFWSEGEGGGRIEHDRVIHTADGETGAVIQTANRWVDEKGKVVCTDHRKLTITVVPGGRMIDWEVTVLASHGQIVFGDTKEGTMGIRTHPNLRLENAPARGVTTANGQAANSEGATGKDVWGKRARWVDYWGQIDGQTVGIAIMDHPDNIRHPTWWHARAYGLVTANPFGVHAFEGKPEGTGDFRVPAGQSVTFRYRFIFHEGDVKTAKIAEKYDEYAGSAAPRVLDSGQLPNDRRLGDLKNYNGDFFFAPPTSRQEWDRRAEQVRRRILVATGLWPMPPRGPVEAVVHGRVDRDDYTVEKVYLESYPGHFVSGNLYRPKEADGPRPAVLCPHGHWGGGRFYSHSVEAVRKEIVEGAERFEVGGRYPLQARCVQLARMGCIVFHYDMVGYADSQQIPHEVAHYLLERRPEMDGSEDWGLFSTQAELRLQHIMGLQTFNSIRALDWITSLPDVDAQRVAVTGASGGGTQTMILCAIDPRPAVAVPAVMVSTSMQGGCTCENSCCLRVGTGNIEFAALFAPKPQYLTSADDWTKELQTKGFPELKELYQLTGAEDHVGAKFAIHFPHNYNHVSRAAMYSWVNEHLQLGFESPVLERDYEPLSKEEMSVWNEEHPAPSGGVDYERALMRALREMSDRQMAEIMPGDAETLDTFRQVAGGAFEVILGRGVPTTGPVQRQKVADEEGPDYTLSLDLLRHEEHGEELPALFLHPEDWNGDVVIWIDGQGKRALFAHDGMPIPQIRQLLEAGFSIATADLLFQGEFLGDDQMPVNGRTVEVGSRVPKDRDFAGYPFGYNPTLFAQRVHDILTLASFVIHDEHTPRRIHLVGVGGAGPWVVAARALVRDKITSAAVDTGGFRFGDLESWRDADFLPGAVKYGDLPALLALAAPGRLWMTGEGGRIPDLVRAAYGAAGQADEITSVTTDPAAVRQELCNWLTLQR